jgi:hypothetical protein
MIMKRRTDGRGESKQKKDEEEDSEVDNWQQ